FHWKARRSNASIYKPFAERQSAGWWVDAFFLAVIRSKVGEGHGAGCTDACTAAICIHHILSHHFPRHYHWIGQLPGGSGRVLAENSRYGLLIALPILAEDFRSQFRHGRRVRPGDGLSVRDKLERFLGFRRGDYWAIACTRGTYGILPGGRVSRSNAFWHEQGRARAAFPVHHHGGDWYPGFRHLDSCV